MSKTTSEKKIGETKNKNLKMELTVDETKTEIVNKIVTKISELLDDQTGGGDTIDGIITLFEETFQPILDKFKELIGENKDKKNFVGGLIKIFITLLSTKIPTLRKIKKVVRTSIKIALELWNKSNNTLEQKQQSED